MYCSNAKSITSRHSSKTALSANRQALLLHVQFIDKWVLAPFTKAWSGYKWQTMNQHCVYLGGRKHLKLLHSSYSAMCCFVLQVGRPLLFWFFLQCTSLCKQTWNSCDTSLSGDTVLVFNLFRHRLRDGGEISKRCFYFENASVVFRQNYTVRIWKHNNRLSVCVWEKLGQGNHIIIVMSSFTKSSVFEMFSVRTKTQSRNFKFLRFEERFWKAPFSWRISVNSRTSPRNNALFSNFSRVLWTGKLIE